MGRHRNTVERMIREHVEKTPTCWLWRGPVTPNGYAKATILTDSLGANRVFYEYFKGAVPAGHFVRRSCRERRCVNPEHLIALPAADAIMLGNSPPSLNAKKHECIRGHALAGENLYVTPDGRRQCRACSAIRSKNSKRKPSPVWTVKT